jgi:indolepyruvate ferredoxin oxidoreductase alpha subunit
MVDQKITGSEALAHGALEAGVRFVTGYPGSPSTGTVEALLRLAGEGVRIEWATNEKSAFDAAFGASLAGVRSLLCLKSVGLNVALDCLMVSNLAAGDGGFVILVGDDPGGWGSQNEEDSRPLLAAAEIPVLEPTTHSDARPAMCQAFDLSERFRVPVAVRITRALAVSMAHLDAPRPVPESRLAAFRRQPERFNVLPLQVVDFHQRLQATVEKVGAVFEASALNGEEGLGKLGVIAAGHVYDKVRVVLETSGEPPLRVLRLGTLHPLPEERIATFLGSVDAALIVEEIAPHIETGIQAIAQRAGLTLPLYGRHSGHVPRAGELFADQITRALGALLPDWPWPTSEPGGRARPSRQPLCDDCPYIPALEALLAVMARQGGREAFVVTGETGCMVRAQLPPFEIMDLKYGMGSSIGLAAGLARTGIRQRIVALSGDSALLHSGLAELIDAVQAAVDLLVVVLANETTALSGGQPHPGTGHDALGTPRQPVDLAALIRAAGVDWVRVVDPFDGETTQTALEEGLATDRVSVVIVERACPLWEGYRQRWQKGG